MVTKATPTRQKPRMVERPAEKMAVAYSKGVPAEVLPVVAPALYGAVYKLKFALKKEGHPFTVQALRARWPDAHLLPKEEWTGIWGLPVLEDTKALEQKVPGVEVKLEEWSYGTVAEILHIGPYLTEGPTVRALHDFIEESGYEIAGLHEEEYLTSPNAKVQKTIIRYPVRKR
jgi:hypothetical protein